MNQDDKLGAFLRTFDPGEVSYERLDLLESKILRAAMATPQRSFAFEDSQPLSRSVMMRWATAACLMLFLGMMAGQELPRHTVQDQRDLATVALSMPWQELAQNGSVTINE